MERRDGLQDGVQMGPGGGVSASVEAPRPCQWRSAEIPVNARLSFYVFVLLQSGKVTLPDAFRYQPPQYKFRLTPSQTPADLATDAGRPSWSLAGFCPVWLSRVT